MQTPVKSTRPKRRSVSASPSAKYGMSNNFIFIVCLLIASISWMLIKLSSTYTETYSFKVNFTDLPVDKKLTVIADSNVNISFTDQGFKLLRLELFSNLKSLKLSVNDYDLINEKNNFFQISTKDVKKYLAEETGISADDILFSKPFLGFEMEKLYTRKIAVVEKHKLKFREQYDLYGEVVISPKKVTVYGPKDILDTIQTISTETISLNQVESDQSIISNLINPFPKVLRFDPEQVTVNFKVEKFTETSIDVPVVISSIQEPITIFPKTVKVSFKIAQKDFNNIDPGLFVVSTEAPGAELNSMNKLKLKLTKKPDFIIDELLMPAEVEFLIIK